MSTSRIAALMVTGALALAAGACEKQPVGPAGPAKPSSAGPGAAGPERVRVDLYVMSMCPYGVQAENAFAPVVEKLGPALDLRIEFIASEENGKLVSLHDEPEVKGDIAQLCAAKIAPDRAFKLILCQNKTPREIPDNWEACAKEVGIDVEAMRRCYTTSEGQDLLRVSAKRAAAAKAEGSPTIHIAGRSYEGRRRDSDLLRAICAEFQSSKPPACAEIKPPAAITVTILSDSRCKPCAQIQRIVPQLKGIFPGLKHTMLDYGTPEGKKVYVDAKVKFLPAVLFDASLDGDPEGAKEVQRFLQPAGGSYRQLAIGAKFDPTGEICDNGKDDNGDGKVDCADPQCRQTLGCRAETKKRLDVFVMSQCPYGVRALDAMKEVLKNFEGQGVAFGVHYIATATPNGFKSLHGQPEVDENIRGVCAMRHYGAKLKFMDYLWCRSPNITSVDWKACAKNGIDPKVIEACSTGPEGKKLLAENIKLAEALGVEASPSWMANNKFPFSGIDAETVKKNLCQHNAGLKGCEKTLSGPPAEGPGAGGGGSCGN
jgi:predicted DsbA family dithiol-disulfide isomerase